MGLSLQHHQHFNAVVVVVSGALTATPPHINVVVVDVAGKRASHSLCSTKEVHITRAHSDSMRLLIGKKIKPKGDGDTQNETSAHIKYLRVPQRQQGNR